MAREDIRIEGAKFTPNGSETGKKFAAKTDKFGDLWLKELRVGRYSLLIGKAGYYPQEIKSISTEKDVNVGGHKAI